MVPSKEGRIPSNRCRIFDFDIDDEFTNLGFLAVIFRLLAVYVSLPAPKGQANIGVL